jgi:hypothetical protein
MPAVRTWLVCLGIPMLVKGLYPRSISKLETKRETLQTRGYRILSDNLLHWPIHSSKDSGGSNNVRILQARRDLLYAELQL